MIKEQKTVIQIYGFFLMAIIFNFLPSTLFQTIGLFLALGLVISAYVIRRRAENGSLAHSHMSYLIKSFWISSLLLVLGTVASFFLADHSIIHDAVDQVAGGVIMSEEQIEMILMDYARANFLIFSAVLAPSVLYLTYRIVKGLILAKDKKPIKNLKSWL